MAQKRSPYDALFRADESAKRAFRRRKAAELRQNARDAQRQKDWPLTVRLWRESLEQDPGDRGATIGLASALIYVGADAEAQPLAESVIENWPEDENGPILLARLAEARGDIANAIVSWRRVLRLFPKKTQALIRLGRLLIAERQFEEAIQCATKLAALQRDNPAGETMLADIEQAQGKRAEALTRRQALSDRFPKNALVLRELGIAQAGARDFERCRRVVERLKTIDPREGLRVEGLMLAEIEPDRSHAAFWLGALNAFPHDIELHRKHMHAVLRDGDLPTCQEALLRMFDNLQLRASDANYVVGVVGLLEFADDRAAIKALVRRFMKRLKGNAAYRLAAVRLSRIIFGYFPNSENPPSPGATPNARLKIMARRSCADPAASSFIDYAADLLTSLSKLGGQALFDMDISRRQCDAFVAEVRGKLAASAPYSFIRIDDGEANAVSYGDDMLDFAEADADERQHVWWGRALPVDVRGNLDARVRDAMLQADALGIPTMARVLRDIRLEQAENFSQSRPGRGIRAVLRAFEEGGELRGAAAVGKMLTSAQLQHDLEKRDAYGALFEGLNDIVAVSCHPTLPERFHARFGATIGKNILIPPRHASLTVFGHAEMGPKILPEVLDDVVAELGEDLRGRLVLIGAGYAGKVLVHEAMQRGAVALDLGSILDYWIGVPTRSYLTAGIRRASAA